MEWPGASKNNWKGNGLPDQGKNPRRIRKGVIKGRLFLRNEVNIHRNGVDMSTHSDVDGFRDGVEIFTVENHTKASEVFPVKTATTRPQRNSKTGYN